MLQRPKFGYDPASRRFAMVTGAEVVQLWELHELGGEQLDAVARLETSHGAIAGIALVRDQLITAHETGVIVGWELSSLSEGPPETSWKVDTGLVISSTGWHGGDQRSESLFAVGGDDGSVVVFRPGVASPPERVEAKRCHDDQVEVIAFHDHQRVATAGRDRSIGVWSIDATDGEATAKLQNVERLEGMGGWPLSVSFRSDGRQLVSGCMDNGVYLWEPQADKSLVSVRFDHAGWVEDATFAAGDEVVVSAGWDNAIGVYGAQELEPRFRFRYHDDYVVRVLPVEGTPLVFCASYDGDVTVWDIDQGRLEAILEGHSDWVTGLELLDDELVVSLSSDRTARVWSVDSLSQVVRLGEAMLEGFELGGGMNLASFGIESAPPQIEDGAGPDLEALQPKVVERFDASDPMVSASGRDTAMTMLEDAVDTDEDIGADVVDRAVEDGLSDSGESAGLGEELSSLVREAISEADEQQESGSDELSPDDSGAEEVDAVDLLDVPEIETASSDQLDEVSSTPPADAAMDDDEADEGFDDAQQLADRAFDDIDDNDDSVDIMGEMFDPPSKGKDQPQGTGIDSDVEEGPKPVGPDDKVADFLPDEDEFDHAFSSSVVELDEGEDDPGPGDDDSESVDSAPRSSRDADRSGDDDDDDDDDEGGDRTEKEGRGPGKFKPPSAGGRTPSAAGGSKSDNSPWDRAQSNTIPGAPLKAPGAPVVDETGGGGAEPNPNQTLSPFNVATEDESDDRQSGDESPSPKRSLLQRLARNLEKRKRDKPDEPAVSSDNQRSQLEAVAHRQPESSPNQSGVADTLEPLPAVEPEQSGAESEVDQDRPSELSDSDDDALGDEQTASRFTVSDTVDHEELRIPEPDDSAVGLESSSGFNKPVRQVDWETLWKRGQSTAPQHGVLRRAPGAKKDYSPLARVETEQNTKTVVGWSSKLRLVVAGEDGGVTIFDRSVERRRHFNCGADPWVEVGFFAGQRFLYGLDRTGGMELWLLPEELEDQQQPVQRARSGAEGIRCRRGCVDVRNGALLVGGQEGTVYLWRLDQAQCVARLEGHDSSVDGVAFGTRGPVTAGRDGTIRFWSLDGLQIDQIDTSAEITDLDATNGVVRWVEASGAVFRIGEGDRQPERLQGHYGEAKSIVSGPGDLWMTAGEDGRIQVYERGDTEPRQEIQVPAPINRLAAEGRRLAAASPGGLVFLFERTSNDKAT